MATKKKNTKNVSSVKDLTNGGIALLITLSTMIGALSGYLIAYLIIR